MLKKRQLSDNTLVARLKGTTKSSETDKSSQSTKQKSSVREQVTLGEMSNDSLSSSSLSQESENIAKE